MRNERESNVGRFSFFSFSLSRIIYNLVDDVYASIKR